MAKITKDEFDKKIKMYQLELYRVAFSIVRTDVDTQNAVCNAIARAFEHRRNLGIPRKFKSWIIQFVVDESKLLLKQSNETVAVNDVIHINDMKHIIEKTKHQASQQHQRMTTGFGTW